MTQWYQKKIQTLCAITQLGTVLAGPNGRLVEFVYGNMTESDELEVIAQARLQTSLGGHKVESTQDRKACRQEKDGYRLDLSIAQWTGALWVTMFRLFRRQSAGLLERPEVVAQWKSSTSRWLGRWFWVTGIGGTGISVEACNLGPPEERGLFNNPNAGVDQHLTSEDIGWTWRTSGMNFHGKTKGVTKCLQGND
ncbi:hypothetical protein BDN72DRAFT_856409 [Pluteus cervinus]|uniref:Uncharacterized protein n=1 Tax=Pluteus cervinus TaxID=181527 RepID=A0ACD3AZA9_9AGAR|nr:hypothetical protein BDN72DRAFT_856409 [Pluteus cervinus]